MSLDAASVLTPEETERVLVEMAADDARAARRKAADQPRLPPIDPGDFNHEGARQLWIHVATILLRDGVIAKEAGVAGIRTIAVETSDARRRLVRFSRSPFAEPDLSTVFALADVDQDAAAGHIRRQIDAGWPQRRRTDAWINDLVAPNGDLTDLFRGMPTALQTAADLKHWGALGQPDVRYGLYTAFKQSKTRAQYDRLVLAAERAKAAA